jgi:hypothetical protein
MAEKPRVPIYRHTEPSEPAEMASYDCRYLDDIERHIAQHIGAQGDVLHEILSLTVHVDVHVIEPSERIPYLTLVTSGMSDLDMTPPSSLEDQESYRLAELIAFLPPDWSRESFRGFVGGEEGDPPGYYPAYWLKHYARMVHEYKTALSWSSTSQNGDPAAPIAEGTDMVGFLFAPPLQLGPEGLFVSTHDDRRIRLLNLVPIHRDEMVFAINKGGEGLCDKLDRAENFIFNPLRQSCLKRKKLFGLF